MSIFKVVYSVIAKTEKFSSKSRIFKTVNPWGTVHRIPIRLVSGGIQPVWAFSSIKPQKFESFKPFFHEENIFKYSNNLFSLLNRFGLNYLNIRGK